MARIRTTKPEFWTDGKVVQMSPFARLLFLGSWNFALCDDGHLPDDAYGLKLKVLPADDVDPTALLDELIGHGVIVRGVTSDGRSYLHIRRLRDHQKTDARWTPRCFVCASTSLPETPPASPELPETRASLDETQRDSPKLPETRLGRERKGKEVLPSSTGVEAEFDRFYSAYPRKVGRKDALKSFERALRDVAADTLIAAAERYAADPNQPEDRSKIPHPSTWLNQGRWADEPLPQRFDRARPVPPVGQRIPGSTVESLIGPDHWRCPAPPEGFTPDEQWEWRRQQQVAHIAERQEQARARMLEIGA